LGTFLQVIKLMTEKKGDVGTQLTGKVNPLRKDVPWFKRKGGGELTKKGKS